MRSNPNKSHMFKHQQLEHGGANPQFTMKVIKFYKTPLARQIAESVRIRRRGGEGAILNSKGEYSRCHIPRLVIEDEEEQEEAMKSAREELLDQLDDVWEQHRRAELGSGAIMGPKSSPQKRVDTTAPQGAKKRRRKTLKYGGGLGGAGATNPCRGAVSTNNNSSTHREPQ